MTHNEYDALPGIRATAIKAGAKSMLHMHAAMTGEDNTDSPVMAWGRLVHAAILEPDLTLPQLRVWDGATKRGKAWNEFTAEHDPDMIVTPQQQSDLNRIACNVHAHVYAHRLIDWATREYGITWQSPQYGDGKALLDGYSDKFGGVELKTARDISERAFTRQFVSLGYDLQLGWYTEGLCAAKGEPPVPWHVIAVESKAPFDVCVYRVEPIDLQPGRAKSVDIATRYRACEREGVYPGINGGVLPFKLPPWYGMSDAEWQGAVDMEDCKDE